MSQITTHILDTAKGKPAANVLVFLEKEGEFAGWQALTKGTTDANGRIMDLLPKDTVLPKGMYKLIFEIDDYFKAQKVKSFYPYIEIPFYVRDNAHYHVPLLLSPFGYSTYRGS